jgi:hypothetical protein
MEFGQVISSHAKIGKLNLFHRDTGSETKTKRPPETGGLFKLKSMIISAP